MRGCQFRGFRFLFCFCPPRPALNTLQSPAQHLSRAAHRLLGRLGRASTHKTGEKTNELQMVARCHCCCAAPEQTLRVCVGWLSCPPLYLSFSRSLCGMCQKKKNNPGIDDGCTRSGMSFSTCPLRCDFAAVTTLPTSSPAPRHPHVCPPVSCGLRVLIFEPCATLRVFVVG